MRIDHSAIEELLQEAAEAAILPFWKALEPGQVEEKSPGELVTLADQHCERFLAERLVKVLPRALVLGEEMVARDPAAMLALQSDRPVWVVDPLDGTRNFAGHSEPFAIMLCVIRNGETLAAWVFDPLAKRLVAAEQGGGTWVGGRKVMPAPRSAALHDMRGALMTRFLPAGLREQVESKRHKFAASAGSGCAGHDYYRLITGELDFLFYYRTLIWDHAPGALIAAEAGCHVSRYDGSRYRPVSDEAGLISTTNRDVFETLRSELLTHNLQEAAGEQGA